MREARTAATFRPSRPTLRPNTANRWQTDEFFSRVDKKETRRICLNSGVARPAPNGCRKPAAHPVASSMMAKDTEEKLKVWTTLNLCPGALWPRNTSSPTRPWKKSLMHSSIPCSCLAPWPKLQSLHTVYLGLPSSLRSVDYSELLGPLLAGWWSSHFWAEK